jgi:TonB family protein
MKALERRLAILFSIGLFGTGVLLAAPDIKMRFLEGAREGSPAGPSSVTSSYEKVDLWAAVPPDYSLDREIAQIRKVFNIKEVRLITEADLQWPAGGGKVFHIIRFEGREYAILITPRGQGLASRFRVEVLEQNDKGRSSLLDTEFQLPASESVVLGFEDSRKTAYFLYLTWPAGGVERGVGGGVAGGVEGGVQGGVSGGVEGSLEGGVKGGVKGGVEGRLSPVRADKEPKVIKKVEPLYPEIARRAGVEGTVILEVSTDAQGRVTAVKVLSSIPLLDQAAVDAVKQWVYAPPLVDGRPQPAVFTVPVRFRLDHKGEKGGVSGRRGEEHEPEAVRATGEVQPPKLLKQVSPVYPEIARQAGVEGVVILEATTNPQGRVVDVRVLRSIPLLDQAAVDALKQWVYEPMKVKGKPTGIIFTVTVVFKLKDHAKKGEVVSISPEDQEFAKGAVKVEGALKPPRLIKEVKPVYPEAARRDRVQGVVILAARIDTSGRVSAVKVLRSIPELDQAAIDAVKQWVYEPMKIKGKPVEAVFTVTVRFNLK